MRVINTILRDWAQRVDDGQPNVNNPEHITELVNSLVKYDFPESFIFEFVGNLMDGPTLITEKEEKFYAKNTETDELIDFNSEEARDKAVDEKPNYEKADKNDDEKGQDDDTSKEDSEKSKYNPETDDEKSDRPNTMASGAGLLPIEKKAIKKATSKTDMQFVDAPAGEVEKLKKKLEGQSLETISEPTKQSIYMTTKLALASTGNASDFTPAEVAWLSDNYAISENATSFKYYFTGKMTKSDGYSLRTLLGSDHKKYKPGILNVLAKIEEENPGFEMTSKGTGKKSPTNILNSLSYIATSFKPQEADAVGLTHIKSQNASNFLSDDINQSLKDNNIDADSLDVYNGKIDVNDPSTSLHMVNEIVNSVEKSLSAPSVTDKTREYMAEFVQNINDITASDMDDAQKMKVLHNKLSGIVTQALDKAAMASADEANNFAKDFGEVFTYIHLLTRPEEVYMPTNGTYPIADLIRVNGATKIENISVKAKFSSSSEGAASSTAEVLKFLGDDSNTPKEDKQKLKEMGKLLDNSVFNIDTNELSIADANNVNYLKNKTNYNSYEEISTVMQSMGLTEKNQERVLGKIATVKKKAEGKYNGKFIDEATPIIQELVYRMYAQQNVEDTLTDMDIEYPVDYAVVKVTNDKFEVDEQDRYSTAKLKADEKASLDIQWENGKVVKTQYKGGNFGLRPKH